VLPPESIKAVAGALRALEEALDRLTTELLNTCIETGSRSRGSSAAARASKCSSSSESSAAISPATPF
jgi:hypothetical protein